MLSNNKSNGGSVTTAPQNSTNMSAALALGIGSAAAGVINGIVGSASNANLNSNNRKWQAEQNTIAYERQKELTQLSPVLQKRGLIQAGIS